MTLRGNKMNNTIINSHTLIGKLNVICKQYVVFWYIKMDINKYIGEQSYVN